MNKTISIHDFLSSHKLSLLGISETHLLPTIPNSFLDVAGYSLVRNDTVSSTAKHGVACYIHQSLTPQQVSSPCQNCLSFLLPTYDLLVVVAYRPPSNSPEANHALIDAIVSTAIGHEVILMGDFNLPSLKWNLPPITSHYIPPSEQLFLDCFDSLGLLQWVSEPT